MSSTLLFRALGSFSCVFLFGFLCSSASCRVADAAGTPVLQALNCTSAAGNYTQDSAYAANLGQLLLALPNQTVSKNGGFFNGTAGNGTAGTVYGLAMCAADFSRADCMDCLTAASSSAGGVVKRCPGSTSVIAMFDQCLLRYSDRNFFGTAETDIVYGSKGDVLSTRGTVSSTLKQGLFYLSGQAARSPVRFAASETAEPFAVVQCTWDLPPDACKSCLDALATNASDLFEITTRGERKSFSCRVRYDVNTSFTLVPFNISTAGTPGPGSVISTKNNNGPVMIGSIIAAVVLVVLISVVVWLCVRHKSTKKVALAGPKSYSQEELYAATNGFSNDRKLGQGAFGAVYLGVLADHSQTHVAVKRIQRMSEAAWQEFVAEITIVSQLKHRNIVDLIGWCDDRNNALLVYELMDRSLDYHLYPPPPERVGEETEVVLDWKKRYNIILDMANGLLYLHTARNECVLHRDIKPSNVMLDEKLSCAKLCDFGLVKQIDHAEGTPGRQTTITGTLSYLDPECIRTSIVSTASDVYSFGLVMLEIVTARQPTTLQHGHSKKNTLVEWVEESFRHRKSVADMADQRLKGEFDTEQIERVIRVGLLCVLPEPKQRPDMATVVDYLKGRTAVPEPYPAGAADRHAANSYESSPVSLLVK
ncbi:cysteine-rich receptor-like protein kinase 8 [Oryza brachyantha]|uniref:cysteine-rich receptor-like protein kinase 8 n=1 Tax=Oryza brachyantha TaxID=4533 RepID=UPI001ADA8C6C|nr:cysteine-rich receptor-like protein kinase 8 [Oryza brachyantha]